VRIMAAALPLRLGDFLALAQRFTSIVVFGGSEPATVQVAGLDDMHVYLYGAAVCFLGQWLVRVLFLNPLASLLLPNTKSKRKDTVKFAQAATEFYVYSFFCFAGLRVCLSLPWMWPSRLWWEGKFVGTSASGHDIITPSFKFFYLLYGGRYLAQLLSVFIEPKRKDFLQMVIHHSATAVLVPLSYCTGYVRIGAAVMLLLDPADPPLHAAKMCKYMTGGNISSRWQWLADRWLEVFAVAFLGTRCGMYPYIVWSAAIEAPQIIDHSKDPGVIFGAYMPDEFAAISLLAVLMVLQFYWASLLIKVVAKALLHGGHAEDARSDDEDDEATEPPAARKKQQ